MDHQIYDPNQQSLNEWFCNNHINNFNNTTNTIQPVLQNDIVNSYANEQPMAYNSDNYYQMPYDSNPMVNQYWNQGCSHYQNPNIFSVPHPFYTRQPVAPSVAAHSQPELYSTDITHCHGTQNDETVPEYIATGNLPASDTLSEIRLNMIDQPDQNQGNDLRIKPVSTHYTALTTRSPKSPIRQAPYMMTHKEDVVLKWRSNNKKTPRKYLEQSQRLILEKEFKKSKYLHYDRRCIIAEMIGMDESKIALWFRNRRCKQQKLDAAPESSSNNKTADPSDISQQASQDNVTDLLDPVLENPVLQEAQVIPYQEPNYSGGHMNNMYPVYESFSDPNYHGIHYQEATNYSGDHMNNMYPAYASFNDPNYHIIPYQETNYSGGNMNNVYPTYASFNDQNCHDNSLLTIMDITQIKYANTYSTSLQ